ncbi:hypothetical protein [Polaribacter sp. M15]
MKKLTEKNITNLKSQRRLNVQEQILLKKNLIVENTKLWKKSKIENQLSEFFNEKGINSDKSIMLEFIEEYFGGNTVEGIILSENEKFYEFEIELNKKRNEIVEILLFEEISYKFEIKNNKKGIKKTNGLLGIEVLNELKNEKKRKPNTVQN